MQRKTQIKDEFSAEDRERKITLQAGDAAPEFSLQNADGASVALKDFAGKKVALYFYPKDNTPGCTTEACEFSAAYDDFIAADCVIIGISPDSAKSHAGFRCSFSSLRAVVSVMCNCWRTSGNISVRGFKFRVKRHYSQWHSRFK